MKKVATLFILLLLVVGVCYAQTPRNPGDFSGNTTTDDDGDGDQDITQNAPINNSGYFREGSVTGTTNVAAVGLNVDGNPGYITLGGCDPSGTAFAYLLWINQDGELMSSSYPTMMRFSSFPTGDWRSLDDTHTGINTVGDQS